MRRRTLWVRRLRRARGSRDERGDRHERPLTPVARASHRSPTWTPFAGSGCGAWLAPHPNPRGVQRCSIPRRRRRPSRTTRVRPSPRSLGPSRRSMPNRQSGPDPEPSGRERQRLLAIVCPRGSVCWICKEPIEFGLRRWHPRGPSMDHYVPRSKGGYWLLTNLRPAHYGCNSSRGNRDAPKEPKRSRAWGST